MLSALVIVIMALTTAVAPSPQALIACRFGAGIGAGLSFVAHIAWASDIAPAGRSGSLTSCFELAVCGGFLATFAVFASCYKVARAVLVARSAILLGFFKERGRARRGRWSWGPGAGRATTMVPPFPSRSLACRRCLWANAGMGRRPAFVVQSFLTFSPVDLRSSLVEIIEAAGGSRRAAGVIRAFWCGEAAGGARCRRGVTK